MALAVSIGAESISLYKDGEYYQIHNTHANYPLVLEELRKPADERDEAKIVDLMDITKFVAIFTEGRVSLSESEIRFGDQPLSGYMVERVLKLASEGLPVTSWARFMDNLMDNPLPSVRDDIYKWMEAGKMPITDDGCITAFKKVRANYTDVHTGKFDNSVGSVLEMPREQCDTNRNRTCSTGFHFCSAGYLSSFGGEKVMVVKVNPRDVTAIPSDYNNHKARCCKYTVVGELTDQSAARHKVWSNSTINLEDPQELPEVMLPRGKGKPPSAMAADPSRVSGAAPKDDLAVPGAQPKATKPSKPKAAKPKKVEPEVAIEPAPQAPTGTAQFTNGTRTFTESEIRAAFTSADGKVTTLARTLGLPKSTLYGWLKKLGLR